MTDASPTPPNRQDPHLDPADDSDEPAFDWMKPAPGDTGGPDPADPALEEPTTGRHRRRKVRRRTPRCRCRLPEEAASARNQQGRRADRKAQEDAVGPSRKGNDAVFSEPLPTSALQIRPPQEDVERRNAERELAAKAKPITPRVMQVLLAVFYPVILLVLAVRAVTSPLFLWVEYNRPGFPGRRLRLQHG